MVPINQTKKFLFLNESCYNKINKKRTNFRTKGVLSLIQENIIDKENITGSNIRRLRKEEVIR